MKTWICCLVLLSSLSLQAKGPCGGTCGNQGGCGIAALTEAAGDTVVLSMPKESWLRLWADELAARDLYAELDQQTRRPVFQNIGRAEVHHRDMIAGLLTAAGHAVPEEPKAGAYGDAEIDQVYAQLLAQGGQGELDAFRAGAAFEELDIFELEREMAREGLSDPERQLLTSLRDASVRHLRAFRRQIVRMGGTPERTHLSEERLNALLGL